MKFSSAQAVESVVQTMILAEWPRARNRTRINELMDGAPPYDEEEVLANNIEINVNDLSGSHIHMGARGQFGNALITPDPLVNIELDYGPPFKRKKWAQTITNELNKRIKKSMAFLEEEESTFCQVVSHGIGPANWQDRFNPFPQARSIEDVLVPSDTLRSMENLPFIAVYRSFTGADLHKMITGPHVDPAWNKPVVERALAWVDQEAFRTMGDKYPDVWKPERWAQRRKENPGCYFNDAVPTIDAYDFYFWDESKKESGWKRRIILDSWGSNGPGGAGGLARGAPAQRPNQAIAQDGKYGVGNKNQYLYDSGDRIYAPELSQFLHFQFGDASAVAPFRYHGVRSLGFLLYAVCHLQNRLKCRFQEHVFENLMQYFRVANPADAERLTKVDLFNKGILPEGMAFVQQQERWQINDGIAQSAMEMNRRTMADNSSNFVQDFDFEKEKSEETATRTMAKVYSTNALVGSMLNRAYNYQEFKLTEIGRRFCIKDSRSLVVKSFRTECLKAGVPEEALCVERWNVKAVRIIGNGNKTLQVAMMDKLMAVAYDKLDPDAQKDMLRLFIAVNSNDYNLANRSVPEIKRISDSVDDASTKLGTILKGLPAIPPDGVNHEEYIETWLHAMAVTIQKIEGKGAMATPDELEGLNNLGQHIAQQIKILAKDKAEKQKVKVYSDDLNKMQNLVKGYTQRLQEQQQKAQKQQPGGDPETQGKIQAMTITAQAKAQLAAESHAQKTAQRQVQFEQKIKQDAIRHRVDVAKKDVETAANIRRTSSKNKSFEEG